MTWQSRNLAHGPYSVSYNGVWVGLTEGVIRHETTFSGIPIRSTFGGSTVLDEIYDGQNHFCTVVFKEWFDVTKVAFNPFASTMGGTGVIGRSKWDLAKQLTLTAVPNTPAATYGPVTRTYYKAVVATDATVLATFGVAERNVPVTFRILPISDSYSITSAIFHFFAET